MPYDTGGTMISAAASAAPPAYGRARAVASYDGLMRDLIHDFKFRDRHDLRQLLGRWLQEAGRDVLPGATMVVPVPLGRWRLVQRSFNQAALLAQDVARTGKLQFAPLALVRVRKTRPQVGLTRLERHKNVSGAFAVPNTWKASIDGQNIVLIDDVITTGATVGACATALKRAGAARVDVLALALVTDTGVTPI
jgi:ComF family protein